MAEIVTDRHTKERYVIVKTKSGAGRLLPVAYNVADITALIAECLPGVPDLHAEHLKLLTDLEATSKRIDAKLGKLKDKINAKPKPGTKSKT